ncbi:uncharacterized protein METZ01_LOCUS516387, partial [marine metagenome]
RLYDVRKPWLRDQRYDPGSAVEMDL